MAKSDIGTITIYLNAVADKFDSGIKKAAGTLGKFEGRMKNTGMAFTEFQSKIGVVSGAFELFGKTATAVTRAMAGDLDGVKDAIKALPFGIGTAAAAVDEFQMALMGTAEAAELVEKRLAAAEKHAGRMAKVSGQSWDIWESGQKWKDKARVEAMFPTAGDPERGRFDAHRKRREQTIAAIKASEKATLDLLDDPDVDRSHKRGAWAKHQKNIEKINRRSTETKKQIDSYFDTKVAQFEQDQQEAADRVTLGLWVESSIENTEDIKRAADQQAELMQAAGADANDVLQARLDGEAKIVEELREQLKLLEHAASVVQTSEFKAEIELDAEKLRREIAQRSEDIAQAAAVNITKNLKAAEDRLQKMQAEPPSIQTNTFQTAVGTFVMPDRDQANRVRQNQLVAQQHIVSEIQGLRRDLKTAANTHP